MSTGYTFIPGVFGLAGAGRFRDPECEGYIDHGACVAPTPSKATAMCDRIPECIGFICMNSQVHPDTRCFLSANPVVVNESGKTRGNGASGVIKGVVTTVRAVPPAPTNTPTEDPTPNDPVPSDPLPTEPAETTTATATTTTTTTTTTTSILSQIKMTTIPPMTTIPSDIYSNPQIGDTPTPTPAATSSSTNVAVGVGVPVAFVGVVGALVGGWMWLKKSKRKGGEKMGVFQQGSESGYRGQRDSPSEKMMLGLAYNSTPYHPPTTYSPPTQSMTSVSIPQVSYNQTISHNTYPTQTQRPSNHDTFPPRGQSHLHSNAITPPQTIYTQPPSTLGRIPPNHPNQTHQHVKRTFNLHVLTSRYILSPLVIATRRNRGPTHAVYEWDKNAVRMYDRSNPSSPHRRVSGTKLWIMNPSHRQCVLENVDRLRREIRDGPVPPVRSPGASGSDAAPPPYIPPSY
ncbi:hypothetical protein BC829DRAFT_441312 [Chytridium lagenaria]|nr:hypothetical protein BC829DRAFT_441312 [Chytridium lagenaria]